MSALTLLSGVPSWLGGDRLVLSLPGDAVGPLQSVTVNGVAGNPGIPGGKFPMVLGQTVAFAGATPGSNTASIVSQDASGANLSLSSKDYGPLYGSFTFSLRSLLPIIWDTGARAISELPPGAPPTLSNFAALTSALAEALTQFGGAYLTRLSQDAAAGDATLQVERAQGLPTAGQVQVDGVAYAYASLSDPGGGLATLAGISVSRGGQVVPGVQAFHAAGAQVAYVAAPVTDTQILKDSFFLDTAGGPELTAIGRNLGVLHSPAVSSDDQYRAIIKAIAYGPKTSIYGLTQALDAILGAGNYTLSEDPVGAPAQVLIGVDYGSVNDVTPFGKTYLSGREAVSPASSGSLSVSGPVFGYATLFKAASAGVADESRDYAMLAGTDAATSTAAQPLLFGSQSVPAPTVTVPFDTLPSDLGAYIRLDSGSVTGRFQVAKVTGARTLAVVQGDYATGQLSVLNGASVLSIPLTEAQSDESQGAFTYPRDIGRQVCIYSAQGQNQGVRTITTIYDGGTGTDLSTLATPLRQRSHLCGLSGAPVQPQTGVAVAILPVFPAQTGLTYRMAGNLVVASDPATSTIKPRQALPSASDGFLLIRSDVLSALVTPSDAATNVLDPTAPTFDQYPLFIDAPFGVLDAYLSDLTAAGVKPTLQFT